MERKKKKWFWDKAKGFPSPNTKAGPLGIVITSLSFCVFLS